LPVGEVEVYQSEKAPPADIHTAGQVTFEDLAQYPYSLDLAHPVRNPVQDAAGGRSRMANVAISSEQAAVFFTPITRFKRQARPGKPLRWLRADPPSDLILVDRVEQVLVAFRWPPGAARVDVWRTPPEVPAPDPSRTKPFMSIGREDYNAFGGFLIRRDLRFGSGPCALHLAGFSQHAGSGKHSPAATIRGAFPILVRYRIEVERKKGIRGPKVSRRLVLQSNEALAGAGFALVWSDRYLPLSRGDGSIVETWNLTLQARQPHNMDLATGGLPEHGFVRLIAEALHDPMPGVAGGQVIGVFGYTSVGEAGWSVTAPSDLGGLGDDAIQEGRGLVERIPWWDKWPIQEGADVLKRPRRLAWLGGRTSAPRRFLLHTIHCENDASTRPGNNYTECWVVGRREQVPGSPDQGGPGKWLRPSQLWDPIHWRTPWGAEDVARQQPGAGPFAPPMPQDEVLQRILQEPTSLVRLRLLHRMVHDALHGVAGPIMATVDDLIWGAVLLDTCLRLMPDEDVWEATFDLRSIAPQAMTVGAPDQGQRAMVNLYEGPVPGSGLSEPIDLTEEAATSGAVDMRLEATTPRQPCLTCGTWYPSMAALLAEPKGVQMETILATLSTMGESSARRRALHEMSTGSPPYAASAVAATPTQVGLPAPKGNSAAHLASPIQQEAPALADRELEHLRSLEQLSTYLQGSLVSLRGQQPVTSSSRLSRFDEVWATVERMCTAERATLADLRAGRPEVGLAEGSGNPSPPTDSSLGSRGNRSWRRNR
jgi:hypothetical protein